MVKSIVTPSRLAGSAAGLDLGQRIVQYAEGEVILYALAVGAPADELELVFERDLRVLPTFGLALGLWAPDELGRRGLLDISQALHGAQTLEVLEPLPAEGRLELDGRVAHVWDKGSAAVFDIEVSCRYFRAVYSIFAPGSGGWGGDRGPAAPRDPSEGHTGLAEAATAENQAALYRLTGDRHLIHVDPEAARAIGQPRPILHGLCTLGVVARTLARVQGRHACDLRELRARFSAPVLPGESIEVRTWPATAGVVPFAATTERGPVLTDGAVRFG